MYENILSNREDEKIVKLCRIPQQYAIDFNFVFNYKKFCFSITIYTFVNFVVLKFKVKNFKKSKLRNIPTYS